MPAGSACHRATPRRSDAAPAQVLRLPCQRTPARCSKTPWATAPAPPPSRWWAHSQRKLLEVGIALRWVVSLCVHEQLAVVVPHHRNAPGHALRFVAAFDACQPLAGDAERIFMASRGYLGVGSAPVRAVFGGANYTGANGQHRIAIGICERRRQYHEPSEHGAPPRCHLTATRLRRCSRAWVQPPADARRCSPRRTNVGRGTNAAWAMSANGRGRSARRGASHWIAGKRIETPIDRPVASRRHGYQSKRN